MIVEKGKRVGRFLLYVLFVSREIGESLTIMKVWSKLLNALFLHSFWDLVRLYSGDWLDSSHLFSFWLFCTHFVLLFLNIIAFYLSKYDSNITV